MGRTQNKKAKEKAKKKSKPLSKREALARAAESLGTRFGEPRFVPVGKFSHTPSLTRSRFVLSPNTLRRRMLASPTDIKLEDEDGNKCEVDIESQIKELETIPIYIQRKVNLGILSCCMSSTVGESVAASTADSGVPPAPSTAPSFNSRVATSANASTLAAEPGESTSVSAGSSVNPIGALVGESDASGSTGDNVPEPSAAASVGTGVPPAPNAASPANSDIAASANASTLAAEPGASTSVGTGSSVNLVGASVGTAAPVPEPAPAASNNGSAVDTNGASPGGPLVARSESATAIDPATTTTTGANGDGDRSSDGGNGPVPAAQPNHASSLLRVLADEEANIAHNAMYGPGSPDEIVAILDTDSVQRQSLHKLQPGIWLNDEVIHYYLQILAKRDSELAARSPGRKRSHFFKSFFITKLLDEAGYNYENVERWSQKVPGKDIFALDKIFFPSEY